MKIIGTDICLDECKNEGYLMVQYDARKKFDINTEYRVFAYYPEYSIEDSEGGIGDNELAIDTYASFSELLGIYNKYKSELNSFAETDKAVNFDNPNYRDFLNLASDINSYCGLP
jgi:hypothetical protein